MRHRFRLLAPWLGLVTVVLFGSGAGCDSNDTGGVILPPLVIRSNFPVDEAYLYDGFSDSLRFDLSVVFIRGSSPGDARFQLYPPPLSVGETTLSSTGRTWTWRDVWFSTAQGAYYWLIDGEDIPVPKVVRLATGPGVTPGVGFAGTISSSNPAQMSVAGTIVFALTTTSGFNPLDPATFFDADIRAVSEVDSLGDADARDFRTTYMPQLVPYYVVAILDTTGDAFYDPTVDAWGYREATGGGGPEPILTDVPPLLAPNEYRSDVDFTIFPAAVMKERELARATRSEETSAP